MKSEARFFDGWRRRQGDYRRLAAMFLLAIGLVIAIAVVFWIARGLGLGAIGQFYEQADELGTP